MLRLQSAFRLRSISTELTMIFSCEPCAGNTMLPGGLVTSSCVAASDTVVVTGGVQWTTVDAVAVAGFGGTTGL